MNLVVHIGPSGFLDPPGECLGHCQGQGDSGIGHCQGQGDSGATEGQGGAAAGNIRTCSGDITRHCATCLHPVCCIL